MSGGKYRWDKGWRVRVLGLLVFLLAVMVSLGSTLTLLFGHLHAVQEQAERTRESVLYMEQATGTFAEMTSALRGYLLTGQEPFLQPYLAANAVMDRILQQLETAAMGDPTQMERVQKVENLVHAWQVQVAEPEIAAKRAQKPEAGSLVANGSGLNYIEEIRTTGQAYIATESRLLRDHLDAAAETAEDVQRATWFGVGLATILALVGFGIFARSITSATGTLAAAAGRIAAGDRGVVIEAPLDGELQEVAEAFTAMSMTLAAQEEELQAQQEELIAQNEQLMTQSDELQARTAELELQEMRDARLNRFGQALIGTIGIDEVCTLILDEYLDLFGATAGALFVADSHSDQFVVLTERWLSPDWRGQRVRPAGPLARCVDRAESVTARYPETATHISVWGGQVPVCQETYLPLVHAGRVIAVAVLASTEVKEAPEEALVLWSAVARQAAVAISAALSHLEVRRGLQALQEQAAQVEELNAQLEEERDRASAQLDIYNSIVANMPAGAWLTDTGGHLLVTNAPFQEFFGDLPDDANFEDSLALLGRQVPPTEPFLLSLRALLQTPERVAEGTIQLNNGYVLKWSSAPVGRGHGQVGRLFTFQDVTELAKLDRMKSEFVNTVSHELRTPLTSIVGYLSLVLSEQVGKLEPTQKEFLSVVQRNTDRLSNLINDLLDVQRIEAGRMPLQCRPVQLADIVRHVAETFRMAAEQKGLDFTVLAPAESTPLLTADPDRLTQIASNLVSNAVKYTREGQVRVTVEHDDMAVRLLVEDTGVGIPPAEQKRVFEKFFRGQTKYAREAGGTGLGLSIVKMLVEQHGGTIKVESDPGHGTRFTVSFPLVLDAPLAG